MRWQARIVNPRRLEGCTVITQSGRAYRVLAVTERLDLVVEQAKPIGAIKRLQTWASLIKGFRHVP